MSTKAVISIERKRQIFILTLGVSLAALGITRMNSESFLGLFVSAGVYVMGVTLIFLVLAFALPKPSICKAVADLLWMASAAVGVVMAFSLSFADDASKIINGQWEALDSEIQRNSSTIEEKFSKSCPSPYAVTDPCNDLRLVLDIKAGRRIRATSAHRLTVRQNLSFDSDITHYSNRIEDISDSRQSELVRTMVKLREEYQALLLIIPFALVALRLAKSLVELLESVGWNSHLQVKKCSIIG
jgi:hypothetical protein